MRPSLLLLVPFCFASAALAVKCPDGSPRPLANIEAEAHADAAPCAADADCALVLGGVDRCNHDCGWPVATTRVAAFKVFLRSDPALAAACAAFKAAGCLAPYPKCPKLTVRCKEHRCTTK